jgi:hypothetical protein
MPDGSKGPISVQRRAGLQTPQLIREVVWDGLVPAAHREAFAHRLIDAAGQPQLGRWQKMDLYGPGKGCWRILGWDSALSPQTLSAEGWGYGAALVDAPAGEVAHG